MAFHVACPITCRKICFCALGFSRKLRSEKGKEDFLQEVSRVEQFLNDPWLIKARENATIQVKVPKVIASPALLPPPQPLFLPDVSVGARDEAAEAASAQVKRAALQKQAAAASMVAEDYARKFESGDLNSGKDVAGEEQVLSTAKVMCRLCYSGEYEGSERARKLLPCKTCGKKYHRSCLKTWSQNRDLFHWSSWTCPSCRSCEVCLKTEDSSKFMFCKRCDGAYHCYCQQPPHKNVGHGLYLCPKHTKCHSCASSVPGNGLSVRWFLGYTCCDACGRLFVKGNYCPVCLKVYRDSESTPMVCCDVCHKWVHCPCDGISDSKYMQFQVDGNLQYVCPTCRGECCQVRSLEEAAQEIWRRRDESEKDLIASLRAAAGLPTQDEIFDISPFSDDEESGPVLKNEFSRSLKFSLKGLGDNSPKKNKESGKKSSKKKSAKKKRNENEEMRFSSETDTLKSPTAARSLTEGVSDGNEAAVLKHKSVEEVSAINITKASRTIKIKSSNRSRDTMTNKEETGISSGGASKTAQGPKLVIHLGGRSRNATSPSRPESKRVQELTSVKGSEDTINQLKHPDLINRPETATKYGDQKGHKKDRTEQVKGSKLIKLKNNTNSEPADGYESISPKKTTYSILGKRSAEDGASARSESEVPVSKRNKHSSMKHAEEDDMSTFGNLVLGDSSSSMLRSSSRDRKPPLKFKIPKTSINGNQKNVLTNMSGGINQNSLPLPVKEDITYTRGQRSKRRRPAGGDEDGGSQWGEDNTVKDFTDANWILQKLGKDAAGKRVEIHQPSDNSWHRGTVKEIFEGTSFVSIALDDGKSKRYELGKQGIRFVSQKQKH